jgi:predicted nucleic acid-binding protein
LAACWDSSLFSRVNPGTDEFDYFVEQAALGAPVAVAAGAILERAYGFERRAVQRPAFAAALGWLQDEVVAGGLCQVVPLDGRAALVAGRLRARAELPPARKGDRRTKAQRRVAWQLDLQIAATCWAAGYDIATANRIDFEVIAAQLSLLAPTAPELVVLVPPV